MRVLKKFFAEYHDPEDPLIIILPDFESFSTNVLHDFILVLRYFQQYFSACDKKMTLENIAW